MSATSSTLKPRLRSQITLKSETVVDPQPVARIPDEPIPELITTLAYLERKKPDLTNLVADLDLVEVSQPRYIAASIGQAAVVSANVPYNDSQAKPIASPGVNLKKLQEIAITCLPGYAGFSEEESIKRICNHTGVSIERARNGLALMLEHDIISVTPNGIYYLFDTAPF